jgi:hypothetical protein
MSIDIHSLVRRGLIGAALSTALFSVAVGSASAATSSGSTTANVAVQSGISLTGLTPSFTLTGAPGTIATSSGAVNFNVETNDVAGYAVTVQSAAATLAPTLVGNTDSIPISLLGVRQSGPGAYLPISNVLPTLVHTQASRSANGGDNLSNDYQITVPVVNPDTYTATLNYVATAL